MAFVDYSGLQRYTDKFKNWVKETPVNFAYDIATENTQQLKETFYVRKSVTPSASKTTARLMKIKGVSRYVEGVDERYTITKTAPRQSGQPALTFSVNKEKVIELLPAGGYLSYNYYSQVWHPSLPSGLFSSAPSNVRDGDSIYITYFPRKPPHIYHSAPSSFVSAGWNLLGPTGVARLFKYSDNATFRIEGPYTRVSMKYDKSGTTAILTVNDGMFSIPLSGLATVTGFDETTCVYMTWDDWTEGYEGDFQSYYANSVNLNPIRAIPEFENGLFQVGSYQDTIDFKLGVATSYIERLDYSEENIAIAEASGRPYQNDEEYIYLVREVPVQKTFDIDNTYTAYNHGSDYFEGTAPTTETVDGYDATSLCETEVVYGDDLVGDLKRIIKLPFITKDGLPGNAGFHNSIYRGKYLGTSVTDEQYAAIRNGTFDDLYIGDWWTIGGLNYVICDFDYYYSCNYPPVGVHHIVVMPASAMSIPEGTQLYGTTEVLSFLDGESALYKKWNETDETNGGYVESRMRQIIMRAADTIVVNLFGESHVLAFGEFYPDVVTDGVTSNASWCNSSLNVEDTKYTKSICDLCNETMIYGQQILGLGGSYKNVGMEIGIDRYQLSIFSKNRNFIPMTETFWLRNVVSESSTNAVIVTNSKIAGQKPTAGRTSTANAIQPRFLLVG